MAAHLILRYLSWGLSTLLEVVLLVYLVRRKLYRSHPAFTFYILVAILESAIVAASYRLFGLSSMLSFNIAWGTQAVVICARAFAVVEIARRVLADYPGIWALANRVLFVLGFCVLGYSIAASEREWTHAVLKADRAVELCIASFIVGLVLFVRYYRVPMNNLERMLAIGFCLYSCFFVINDSILVTWFAATGLLWNYLDMLTFLASLTLWIGAVSKYSESPILTTPAPLTAELHGQFSRKLNARLHALNNRLDHLFRSEEPRP
jgi:hypothetical protein